jgi:hypothetical protein
MSWLYSRVLVEEYLAENCSGGEQSVQSNSTNTPEMYLWQGKMMEASKLSRYGMTCEPLTENRGEDILTLFLEAFHAKTYQSLENRKASKVSEAGCGESLPGLSEKLVHDTVSLKTAHNLFDSDLIESLKTLPKWGMLQSGVLSEQDTSLIPIKETESGYWPTPNCMDCLTLRSRDALIRQFTTTRKGRTKPANLREAVHPACYPENLNNAEMYEQAKSGGQLNPNWEEWLMGWPIGWTELNALEMDKFQQWLDLHGIS